MRNHLKTMLRWLCIALYWVFFVFVSVYLGFFVRETVGDSTGSYLLYTFLQILVGLGTYDVYKVVFGTDTPVEPSDQPDQSNQ